MAEDLIDTIRETIKFLRKSTTGACAGERSSGLATLIRASGIEAERDRERSRSLDCLARAVTQRLEGGERFAHHPAATLGLRREGDQPRFVVAPTRHIDRRSSCSKYASIKAIERISAVTDLTRNRS